MSKKTNKEEKDPKKKDSEKGNEGKPSGKEEGDKGAKKDYREKQEEVNLIRILSRDLRGSKDIYSALTQIKGVSWSFSNALCKKLELKKSKKVQELSKDEIKKIEEFIVNPDIPHFLKNRRKDYDTGEDKNLSGADLDLKKDFDIKRLKKIKSYRGGRHAANLPVRGQRTKSNFRRNRKKSGSVGVKTKGKSR